MKQRVQYIFTRIRWYFNGKLHRDGDLPALYYFYDGKLIFIVYYQHNKYHRTTGPAIIEYDRKIKEYWYQDKKYTSLEEIQMLEACR